MTRLTNVTSHLFPFTLAIFAGLLLAFSSDAAPTGSSLDIYYRFAVGTCLVLGLRQAPWPLLFVCSLVVGVFADSPVVLAYAASGIVLTLGFFLGGTFCDFSLRRGHHDAQVRGVSSNLDAINSSTNLRLLWVALTITISVPDLADRWATFSASAVVGSIVIVAIAYLIKGMAPTARPAALGVVGVAAIGVFSLTGYYGWEAKNHVTEVEQLRASLDSEDMPNIATLDSSLSDLQSSLNRKRFRILEGVPLAAQNVRSARQLMDDAGEVIDAAQALNETPENSVNSKSSAAILQKDELTELCWALANFDSSLQVLSGEEYLVPTFKTAVVELDSKLGKYDQVDRYCPVANRVEELLGFDGKRTYLTLFMTTAEVRGIGGLVTNWALLEFDKAEVDIIDSGRSVPMNEQLANVNPTLTLPEDTEQLWEIYAVDKYFQDIGVSPDGEVVASTASQLFAQVQPEVKTDGVMILGPKALAGLVATVGDVKVGDYRVDAEGTVDFLTKDQYELDISYGERVQMLEMLLDGVAGGGEPSVPADPVTSLRLLGEAVSSGELMLLPNDPEVRKELEGSPLLGSLPLASEQQLVGVVEQNLGLDKLDPYLKRSAELVWDDPTDSSPVLTLHYSNSATSELPEYVLGIGETAPGVNRLRVASYAPVQARSVAITDSKGQTSNPEIFYGSEKGHQASVVVVDTPPGQSTTVQFEFEDWLPPADAVQILKPASINDRSTSIVIGNKRWSGSDTARLSTVQLD